MQAHLLRFLQGSSLSLQLFLELDHLSSRVSIRLLKTFNFFLLHQHLSICQLILSKQFIKSF